MPSRHRSRIGQGMPAIRLARRWRAPRAANATWGLGVALVRLSNTCCASSVPACSSASIARSCRMTCVKHFHRIDVYEVDTRLLKELLKHGRQAFQLIEGKPCACNSDVELRVSAFLPHFLGRLLSEELLGLSRRMLNLIEPKTEAGQRANA